MNSPKLVFDVVVIGAGNAALAAAVAAHQHKARVLVLEKAPYDKRGGNSYFTDGAIRFAYNSLADIRLIIPEMSDEEAERIILPPYSVAQYYEDFQRITQGQTDPILSRTLIQESLPTMLWMQALGIKFEMLYDNQAFKKDGKYRFWGGLVCKTAGKGIGLINRWFEILGERGVAVWYDAAATKIHLHEDGGIQAVSVVREGKLITLPTRAVVLACGSYEGSMKKRIANMGPEWEKAILRGTEYNTGDGLDMALAVGAVPYGDWKHGHAVATDARAPKVGDFTQPGDIYKKSSYPLGIMVNKEGGRFVDEGADFRNYTYAKYGRMVLRQTDALAYQIFDQHVAHLLRSEYREAVCTKYEADTIAKLAEQLGIDQASFIRTVHEYNQSVQKGAFNPHILDGKGTIGLPIPKSNWANTLSKPPF